MVSEQMIISVHEFELVSTLTSYLKIQNCQVLGFGSMGSHVMSTVIIMVKMIRFTLS